MEEVAVTVGLTSDTDISYLHGSLQLQCMFFDVTELVSSRIALPDLYSCVLVDAEMVV